MSAIQNMNSLAWKGQNATRQMAQAMLDGQEKMVRVNLDAAEALIKQGTQQLKEACVGIQQPATVDRWPQMVMDNIQRGTAFNLEFVEIARQLQQEMTCAVEEGLRAVRDNSVEAVDQWKDMAKLMPSPFLHASAVHKR